MRSEDVFSQNPDVMSGALVFAGTRVPAEALFESLVDGMTLEEFLENFPAVERHQAEAAIRLGSKRLMEHASALLIRDHSKVS